MRSYTILTTTVICALCYYTIAMAGEDIKNQEQLLNFSAVDIRSIVIGASGGLLSSLASVFICIMQNRHSIKMQKNEYDYSVKKILNEERRHDCLSFIYETNPDTIISGNFSIEKSIFACNKIELSCSKAYHEYANNLIKIILSEKKISMFNTRELMKDTTKADDTKMLLLKYKQFHEIIIKITQLMLEDKSLLPAGQWKLDNFEGSVPLDYRQSLP